MSESASLFRPDPLPWKFSQAPESEELAIENLPTSEGRLLGAELARLCDLEEPRVRERFPRMQPRCDDCAFRAGTRPNGCVETLMDAIKCVYESVPFYCHKGVKDGEPKRLCGGFGILVDAELPPSTVVHACFVAEGERG